jgi:glycosyltransferase involved in cell wall biosynthesis
MHILLLPSWYSTVDKPWRGTFFADQARALAQHGLRSGLAFVERRSLSRLTPIAMFDSHFQVVSRLEEGIPTMRMKGWSTFAQTTTGAMLWVNLTRKLVRTYAAIHGTPDVIHGHSAMWGGYAAMIAAEEIGRPYVITEHASSIMMLNVARSARKHLRDAYRNAARVIAVSRALKSSVDCISGRDAAVVMPNTVDSEYFSLPPTPRAKRPFVFLSVGDLVPSKRIDLLIHAFARLRQHNRDTRLVIAGDGKERVRLEELASLLGVDDAIEMTGSLSRPAVRQQMWEANALVMPSDFETFGVVLIEAMSTGLPVIATRCGGPEEVVNGEAGSLVDCNDGRGLLRAMAEFLTRNFDPAAIRSDVTRRFGYTAVANALCSIYAAVAGRRTEVA